MRCLLIKQAEAWRDTLQRAGVGRPQLSKLAKVIRVPFAEKPGSGGEPGFSQPRGPVPYPGRSPTGCCQLCSLSLGLIAERPIAERAAWLAQVSELPAAETSESHIDHGFVCVGNWSQFRLRGNWYWSSFVTQKASLRTERSVGSLPIPQRPRRAPARPWNVLGGAGCRCRDQMAMGPRPAVRRYNPPSRRPLRSPQGNKHGQLMRIVRVAKRKS